jgi:beta-fructofuranosidase
MGAETTSPAPHRRYADTFEEQEVQLSGDALLERFRESRARLAADPHRPLYHFVSPESNLNDPNGLCFWQGRWHLFHQGYPPEAPRPHWGHAVSDDLIHWRDLPYAIVPGPEEACWSGSALVEPDRVVAIYHGHKLGNMVAVSSDPLLLNWEKVTGTAVIPNPCPIWTKTTGTETMAGVGGNPVPAGAINVVYDPCIWRKGEWYYSLSGGTLPHAPSGRRTRALFLFRSPDLASWEYVHPFCEHDIFGLPGDDGACPYFWPIGDRHILLHFSHMSGGKYLLGDYDTERDKFVVSSGGNFNFGAATPGGVHAPSAAPDGQGGVVTIFNMNAAKPTEGWNQIMSLPRRLTLSDRDELTMEPTGDIESLRYAPRSIRDLRVPANREMVLEGIEGNTMELNAEIDPGSASMIELNVLRSPAQEEVTRIAFFKRRGCVDWERSGGWSRYDESRDSIVTLDTGRSSEATDVASRPPESAPVWLRPDECLKLRVFVDRSIVEVFVNDRQCVAARVYPGRPDSIGVSLRAQGGDAVVTSLDAWQMRSIYR